MNTTITRRYVTTLIALSPVLLSESSRSKNRSIDETGFIRIGGIEQWISIQGDDAQNPAILFLHGGPGEAQSPFLENFIPWKKDFTVVNWDQRGSGRTYGRNGPSTPDMSTPTAALDRLSQDAREVAEYACKKLSQKKVILVGHSWGAELGLHIVNRWPDLFHAFVGTGQPVSWRLKIEGQEKWAKEQAIANDDQETLKSLSETAVLPETDPKRINVSGKYRMSPSDLEYAKNFQSFIGSPPYRTQGDVADWLAGYEFSLSRLSQIEFSFDARKIGADVPIPFFVIQGRDDHIAPFEVAEAYMKETIAPTKAFIPIAGGHFACFTNSTEFVETLRRYVKPTLRTLVE